MNFKYYGLNVENNMLRSPVCTCGCGEYMNLVLKDNDEVFGFMHAMLEEYECRHCGIFAFMQDGKTVLMGLKSDDEIQCYTCAAQRGFRGCLKTMQQDFKLHHYGILEQVDKDSYKIVME